MINDWEFPEFELLERLKRIKEENNFQLRMPSFENEKVTFRNFKLDKKYLCFYLNSKLSLSLVMVPLGQMIITHARYSNPTDDQIIESIRWFLE